MPVIGIGAKLDASTLYIGDNGRLTCGRLACAGSTAHFTGRDLSGSRMVPLVRADADEAERLGVTLRCEACGQEVPR